MIKKLFRYIAVVWAVLLLSATAVSAEQQGLELGVKYSVGGFEYTVNATTQYKIKGSQWYFSRPDNLTKVNEDKAYHIVLPYSAQGITLTAECGDAVYIDGKTVENGDVISIDSGKKYRVSQGGQSYTLQISYGSDLPTLYIDTFSGSLDYVYEDKDNKEAAYMTLVEGNGVTYSKELDFFKGRGNFSWSDLPKKGFSVKLYGEENLLGMGVSERWALIANHSDMSLIRNKLICDFADKIGLEYSPESRYVDLYINGDYMGLYALTEKIEISESRVDITNLEQQTVDKNLYDPVDKADLKGTRDDLAFREKGSIKYSDIKNEPSEYTGGYILEVEMPGRYIETVSGFVSDYGQTVTVTSPEYASKKQVEYIRDYYQQFEDAVLSPDGYNADGKHYSDYIDVESMARMFLIQEYSKNLDAAITSCFLYKDAGGKIFAGPVWDMDSGFGRRFERGGSDMLDPNGLFVADGHMEGSEVYDCYHLFALLWNHKDFRNAVIDIWNGDFVPEVEGLVAEVDRLIGQVKDSRYNDRQLWTGRGFADGDIARWCDDEIEFLKYFITARAEYLSSVYNTEGYKLTYNANGGDGLVFDGMVYGDGDTAILKEVYFTKEGFKPVCWNTKADGTGESCLPGDTLEIEGDTTLYAVWAVDEEYIPEELAPQPESGIMGLLKRIYRKIFG